MFLLCFCSARIWHRIQAWRCHFSTALPHHTLLYSHVWKGLGSDWHHAPPLSKAASPSFSWLSSLRFITCCIEDCKWSEILIRRPLIISMSNKLVYYQLKWHCVCWCSWAACVISGCIPAAYILLMKTSDWVLLLGFNRSILKSPQITRKKNEISICPSLYLKSLSLSLPLSVSVNENFVEIWGSLVSSLSFWLTEQLTLL